MIVSLVVLLLDQISKYLIRQLVPLNHSVEVWQSFFNLVHIQNPGIVFGILSESKYPWQSFFLVTISIGAIIFLICFMRSLRERDVLLRGAISLITGGAAGNLVDRIAFEKVTDLIDLHWRTYHWPAFNIADSAITIGMTILVIQILRDTSLAPFKAKD
jgi:signal peptidase II